MSLRRFPWHTWLGLGVLLASQILLAAGNQLVATWLTPIAWTGLILLVDGIVFGFQRRSWLTTRKREFPLLVLASVGVWLIFEAYNLHLRNWRYEGLPASSLLRDIGYFWSFATIIPGVFEVADLVQAIMNRVSPDVGRLDTSERGLGPGWAWWLSGIAMVTVPLALPANVATYLFGAVWIGFFLLLDPLNEKLGLPSIRRQLRRGQRRKLWALLLGGLICGFIWEFWNQQAVAAGGAFWVYTFPGELRVLGLKFGQMPVLGLLGFPPFALELFAFYYIIRESLGGDRIFGVRPQEG